MRRLLIFLACVIGLAAPVQAAVAFDAVSSSTQGTTNLSWTHTPTGTPRGVLVFCTQQTGTTDEVSSATYGGVSMTEVTNSPLSFSDGTDAGVVYAYTLGASIPTGAQTVLVSVNATGSAKICTAITLTASADTDVVTEQHPTFNPASGTNTATLSLSSRTSFAALGFYSGSAATGGATELTGWTNRLENDFGPALGGVYTYNTVAATDVSAGVEQSSSGLAYIAVAVSEQAAAASGSRRLMLLGIGQ